METRANTPTTRIVSTIAYVGWVGLIGTATTADWNADARVLVHTAIAVAIAAAISSAIAGERGHRGWQAGLLAFSALLAPTGAAAAINLAVGAIAITIALTHRRRKVH